MRGTGYNGSLRVGDIVMTLRDRVEVTGELLVPCDGTGVSINVYPELYAYLYNDTTRTSVKPSLPSHYKMVATSGMNTLEARRITGKVGDENLEYYREVMVVNMNPNHPRVYVTQSDYDGSFHVPVEDTNDALFVISKEGFCEPFKTNTHYQKGTYVVPTDFTGYAYEVIDAGFTGFTEPTAKTTEFEEFYAGACKMKVVHFGMTVVTKAEFADSLADVFLS